MPNAKKPRVYVVAMESEDSQFVFVFDKKPAKAAIERAMAGAGLNDEDRIFVACAGYQELRSGAAKAK